MLDIPAPFGPIGRGNADEHRQVGRHQLAHGRSHAQRQPHAILQAAAVLIAPPVGERRKKLVQQIAVGVVNLDQPKAGRQRPTRGRLERGDDLVDACFVQCRRHGVAHIEGHRAGADDRPAAGGGRPQAGSASPGQIATGLPARVGQLNAGHRSLRFDEAGDPRQRLDMLVAPDAQITGRDPAVGRDSRGFDDDQRHAAGGPAAQMDQVPVVGQSILGDVLTHRRHHDPIAQRHAADRERTEQIDFRHFAVVVGPGQAAA